MVTRFLTHSFSTRAFPLVSAMLVACGLAAGQPAWGQLVGYYTFEGNPNDMSGYGNHGTLTGTTTVTFSGDTPVALSGQSALFDGTTGSNGIITAANTPTLQSLSDAMTISVWIKGTTGANPNWVRYMRKGNEANGGQSWMLNRHSGTADTNIRIDTGPGGFNQNRANDGDNILNGAWHHVVYTLDNGNWAEYLDGNPSGSGTYNHGSGFSNTQPLLIGGRGSPNFVGNLDDAALFTRALSASEVSSLASGAAATVFFTDAGAGSDWGTGTNWDSGSEPLTFQTANIQNNLTAQVTSAGEVAGNLFLGSATAGGPGAGNGTLDVSGGGTLSLMGGIILGQDGTTGTLNITGGGSQVTSAGDVTTAGSGAVNLSNGGTLTLSGNNATLGSDVNLTAGTGTVEFTGTGTHGFSGPNPFSGQVDIQNGTLQLQGTEFSNVNRDYSISSGATLNIDGNTGFPSGTTNISGGGTLLISGGLFGNESPNSPIGNGRNVNISLGSGGLIDIDTGATVVNGGWQDLGWGGNLADLNVDGTLNLWDGQAVQVDALTGNGTVTHTTHGGLQTLTVGVDNGSGTFNGIITETSGRPVALTKTGTGTQTLTGNNDYTGDTNVTGGTLQLQGGAFSTQARDYNISSGATLNLDGNTGVASGTSTISGGGTLLITGGTFGNESPNSPVGSGRNVNMNLGSGAMIDIQSGAELINGGWSAFNWSSNLADMNVDGTLDLWDGQQVRVDALSGSGTITVDIGGASTQNLTVGVDNGGGTFSGVIENGTRTVSVTKEGNGTQTLSGNNTYTGDTNVNGGTLQLQGGAFSTQARNYNISSGATLNLDGNTGVASGTSTISGDGTLLITSGTFGNESPNSPIGSGRNVNMNLGSGALIDIAAGSQITNGGWSAFNWNSNLADLTVNGTLDLWDGQLVRVDALNGSGTITHTTHGGLQGLHVGIDNGSGVFDGVITETPSHPVAFTKLGSGEQRLSNQSNDYSGGTTVSGGLLRANDTTIGTGDLTLENGGIFFNVASAGGGMPGDNNFQKDVTLNAGGGGFRAGWGNMTISGEISGVGGLTIVNDGSVTLTNTSNSYGGNTTIGATGSGNNATLVLGNSEVIPNGSSVIFNASSGGTATLNLNGNSETINGLSSGGAGNNVVENTTGSATLTVGSANASSTYAGLIRDNGGVLSLEKIGNGELQLFNQSNNYSGGTTVGGGLLRANDTSIGTGDLTLENGGIFFNVGGGGGGMPGDTNFQKQVTVQNGGGGFRAGWGNMTISGQITGDSSFTVVNDGSITLTNTGNNYQGDTRIGASGSGSNATLVVGASGVIPDGPSAGNVVLQGTGNAFFNLNGFNETINGLDSSGGGSNFVENNSNTAATLTVGAGDANGTFSGEVRNGSGSGSLALTKIGNGTQTLSGGNITYTGDTNVNAGTLRLQNTGTSFDSGTTTVASGATLDFNVTSGVAQLNNGGQTLTGAGLITKTGGGQLWFGANGQTINISQNAGGFIDVQQGTLRNEYFQGNWTANQGSLNVANGALFRIWDADTTVDALTGSGTINKGQNNTHTLTVGVANTTNNATYGVTSNTATFSGDILQDTGTTHLVKEGTGTQILTGNNSYTGTTTVNDGVLKASSNNALGAFGVGQGTTVNDGGTLELLPGITTNEPLTVIGSGDAGTGALLIDDTPGGLTTVNGDITIGSVGTPNGTIGVRNGTAGNQQIVEFYGEISKDGTNLNWLGNGAENNIARIFGGITGPSPNSDMDIDNMTVEVFSAVDYTGPTTIRNGGVLEMEPGGSVLTTAMTVGIEGDGTVNHDTGTISITGNSGVSPSGDLIIGPGTGTSGVYNLSGGELTFNDTAAGTQVAETNTSTLTVGPNGTFNFDGGTVSNVTTIDPDSGLLTQNGGNLVVGVDGNLTPATAVRAETTIDGNYTTMAGSTLSIDIFGNEAGDFYQGTLAGEGAIVNDLMLTIDDVLMYDPTASDLLVVNGEADLTAGITIDIDTNGLNLPFLGYYDVLLADAIIIDTDTFEITGGPGIYRIVTLDNGQQVLQVATPEPATILIWSLIGVGLFGGAAWRRRRRAS